MCEKLFGLDPKRWQWDAFFYFEDARRNL